MMKRTLALFLALVMTMALVSCGGDTTTSSTPATPDKSATTTPGTSSTPTTPDKPAEPEKPAEPKILLRAAAAAPTSLYAMVGSNDSDTTAMRLINTSWYGVLPIDGVVKRVPILAAELPIDVNGDGLTWNIVISPDAKFWNGEPINADVFMYTMKMGMDPKMVLAKGSMIAKNYIEIVNASAYYTQASTGVPVAWEDVGIKKIDEYTVQVTTTSVASQLLVMKHFDRLAAPIYQPLFEECLSADGATTTYGTTLEKVMGCGPFKLTSWIQGALLEYEKNDLFIREELIRLDGMRFTVMENANTRMEMFKAGELDHVSLTAEAASEYGDDPRIVTIPSSYVRAIEINTNNTEKPILNNKNFRLAMYYATDRVKITKLSGDTPATGYITPLAVAYTEDGVEYKFRTLAAEAGYEPANNGYDPELAKQYFDKAMQEEGLTSLELTLLCSSAIADDKYASAYIQESWQNLFGVDRFKLNIDAQPTAAANTKKKAWKDDNNAYEISLCSWAVSGGTTDPLKCLAVYTTLYSARNAPYFDETINSLYNAANTAENKLLPKVRAQAAMDIEKYIIENAIVIPVLYNSTKEMVSDRVELLFGEYNEDLGWGLAYADIIQ